MQRILIADTSDSFCQALEKQLQADFEVFRCASGKKALELAQKLRPDILVLDLMLPELDGISLLHKLCQEDISPTVLATTSLCSDYVASHSARLGIQYIMLKPCDLQATVSRIHDLSARLQKNRPVSVSPDIQVSNILTFLGIPPKLKGYELLRDAILLSMQAPGQSITKELYPSVARRACIPVSQVERSIRTAIAVGFEKGIPIHWAKYFPPGDGSIQRPSNGVFIISIAEFLKNHSQ